MVDHRLACAVLLPVYAKDRADWFSEALDSILNQVGLASPPRVYVGVDGPIGPDLRAVIEERRSRIFKVVESEINQGLAANLNSLIRALGSESYVLRADADDICEPTRFRDQIEYLERTPNVGIVGAALTEIDSEGCVLGVRSWATNPDKVVASLYRVTAMAHPTVCFRRDSLDRLGSYREDLLVSQDLEMWFRAAKMGIKMANLARPLVRFRMTPGTLKRRGRDKAWAEFLLYWRGSLDLFGVTWRQFFPVFRLLTRLLPVRLSQIVYMSRFREIVTR